MAEGPLSFATGYKQYDDLLGQAIADNQARLSAAPTSPLSNVDPVMLSLAQGLLSPTKTGGFGESLGIAANAIQAPLAAMQKQKLDAQGKIDELQLARAKLAMEAPMKQALANRYDRMNSASDDLRPLDVKRLLNNRKEWSVLKEGANDDDTAAYYQSQIDNIDDEISRRSGVPKTEKKVEPAAPEDTRNIWQRLAPEVLGGEPEPTADATPSAPEQSSSNASNAKPIPQSILKSAIDAINAGADPTAVKNRLSESGYSTEGIE